MWWDWNDPVLTGPISDPPPRLLWMGTLANPILLGTAAWLILVAPLLAFVLGRRAWRAHGGQCTGCGYPVGTSPVCTECGAAVTPSG